MRRNATILLAALLGQLAQYSPAASPDSEIPAVAHAGNQFAVDLYGQLAKEQPHKNLFFSPTSISIALTMTAAGAKGQTEVEMAQALHLTGILSQAHAEYRKALERWNSAGSDGGYTLRLANRLWGQKSFPFLASYLELTRQQYGAELGLVDYIGQTEAARQAINAWVEKQTSEKIKDLLPAGVLDSTTRLVLTNAIYFKGDWASQFKKDQTHEEDFTGSSTQKVKVPLMYQYQSFPFAEDAAVQVLELPYKGDDLSMLVVLPKAADGLPELEKSLSAKRIEDWRASLNLQKVQVYLPRFKLNSSFSMQKTLEGLGMRVPFTDDADFSGMDGQRDLYVSAVIHKALVDVTEEGTEAAAATGVVVNRAPAPRPAIFRANHPFVFMICDRRDGSILFLGRMINPKG
jgi:serpin B